MSSRYIPYARKYFESDEWTAPRKFSEQEAWLDMIFLASFAEHDISLSNGATATLYRGEFYAPYRQLAKRWGWSLGSVQRFLTRLAEGVNPRIEKIVRDTHFDTPSDTQVDTHIIVVKLCNYDSYNAGLLNFNTPSDTHSDTPSDTQDNKGYNNKGDKNTHTHYKLLRDLFVRACWRVHEGADACAEAWRTCEEMLLFCGKDGEAMAEYKAERKRDRLFGVMVDFYRCYNKLQCTFRKPLLPGQMDNLLKMYELDDIWRIIEAIDNKRERIKGASLYQTIKQWATTDIVIANRRREQQPIYS